MNNTQACQSLPCKDDCKHAESIARLIKAAREVVDKHSNHEYWYEETHVDSLRNLDDALAAIEQQPTGGGEQPPAPSGVVEAMQQAFHEADEAGCTLEQCWQAAYAALQPAPNTRHQRACEVLREGLNKAEMRISAFYTHCPDDVLEKDKGFVAIRAALARAEEILQGKE